MPPSISGIHHVTAMAGAPQPNLDFYTGFLGLRLVKQTVNFDDPGTYHFYYGDDLGRPGTALTFFPWPDAFPGKAGAGQAVVTAFAVPDGSLDFWMERFASEAMDFKAPTRRFGSRLLGFRDPDSLHLELMEQAGPAPASDAAVWTGPVACEHAVRGFAGVLLWVDPIEPTAKLLADVFGYEKAGEEAGRLRYAAPGTDAARYVELQQPPSTLRGRMGPGAVHHVAFRARDAAEQEMWREKIAAFGLRVTEVRDRQYFRSIYFREPGGVLFEIATDSPGFTLDESPAELGTGLKLPPWLEPRRSLIEQRLPQIHLPADTPSRTPV